MESKDTAIWPVATTSATGKKWTGINAVQQAQSALHHSDILGQVPRRSGGLGLGEVQPCWNKAASREKMVMTEVCRYKE